MSAFYRQYVIYGIITAPLLLFGYFVIHPLSNLGYWIFVSAAIFTALSVKRPLQRRFWPCPKD